ncbi:MAG: RNA pyrophosphohydrolase [Pseudanabaenaceae cyanobacterium]
MVNRELPYRRAVGVIACNRAGLVLIGERLGMPGAWQFPQGGMDEGETPLAAAQREFQEEVGVWLTDCLAEYPDWLSYDFPPAVQTQAAIAKAYRGQQQRWFLFWWPEGTSYCLDAHTPEFARVEFVPLAEAVRRVVDFKRPLYETLQQFFGPIIETAVHQGGHQGGGVS